MKKAIKILIWALFLVVALAFLVEFISNHNIPVLNPKGMIGQQQKELIIVCFLLMCLVVVPVFIMMPLFAIKYREGNKKAKYTPDWGHSTLAEIIWWGVPFVIIVVLGVITWTSTHALNPYKDIVNGKKPISIQVVALDWKWLFIYPEQGIATVNYIQFPENTPINFSISADAPMNSFWIPQLGGQIYSMPGMTTKLSLIASEKGEYRGLSSNISGTGFAGMTFKAVASSDDEFESWVANVKSSPRSLDDTEYKELVKQSSYVKPIYYSSVQDGLFNKIVMKYMSP